MPMLRNIKVRKVEGVEGWHDVYATINGDQYVRRIESRDADEAKDLVKDKQIVIGWNWKPYEGEIK